MRKAIFIFLLFTILGSSFLTQANAALLPFSDIKIGGKGGTGCWNIQVLGFPVFTCSQNNNTLHITHGSGITITEFPSNHTIWWNGTGSQGPKGNTGATGPQGPAGPNTLDTMQNLGGGQNVYFGNNTNTNFQFNTITATGASSASTTSNLITIYTHTYQNNTGANLGTHGVGPYVSNSGSVLDFLSLVSGNSVCVVTSNSTNQILSCTFTDTNTAQVVSAGSGTSLISSKDNATQTSLKSLQNVTGYLNWNHNTVTITPSFLFKVNTLSCPANSAFISFDNSTGLLTCQAFGIGTVISSQNIGRGTVSTGVLSSPTTSIIKAKNVTSLRTDLITVTSSNSTDVNLNSNFKSDSIICSNQFISAFSNSTGLYTCTSAGTLTTSQNIGKGTSSSGVLATPTSSIVKGKNITTTSPIINSNNSTDITLSCPTCVTSGGPVVLAANVTTTSTTNFAHIFNIALTANSGNAIRGQLVASTNTAGGAVQVGANMSSTATGSGSCTFSYASAATTLTTFASALGTTSSDSAWTTILTGANQAYPIYFDCSVQTSSSPPTLQINFQAEVASTVSIKAGSFYTKTP